MGLMLGLLVGGGFFILKLDDYFKELNFYKHQSEKRDEQQESKVNNSNGKKINYDNKHSTQNKPITKTIFSDSIKNEDGVLKSGVDSIPIHDTALSILAVENTNTEENIVIRKDQLIASHQVEMEILPIIENSEKNDSLLQKVSGIRDNKRMYQQLMNVEFWRSPINYKGYKMAKSKIVLFGISEQEPVKLYRLDERIYIKLSQGVYRIDYTNEFRQFERINDESLLAKLK